MIEISSTKLPAVKVIVPKVFPDERGHFLETYNRQRFAEHRVDLEFVQDNQSLSIKSGTVRGLHFQSAPFAQDKLVRVLRGRIFDVAVDLRRASPTFGRWVAEELTAENRKQLLIPVGFAHGFCTLEPNTEVLYKVSNVYSPQHDLGIAWDDPNLSIDWPVDPTQAILSAKDRALPTLESLDVFFE